MLEVQFWVAAWALTAAFAFFGAFALLRRARMLEDLPTSRIRSCAQGYVELEGHARLLPGPPIVSPLSRQHCAWWSFTIHYRDPDGKGSELVERETSDNLFLLVDPTGSCVVDPARAQVTPSVSRRWRGHTLRPHLIPKRSQWLNFGRYSYHEQQIKIGDMVYATGLFRSQTALMEFNEVADTQQLLAEWKRDQRKLIARFDANADGQIDPKEWDTARRAATQQVRAQQIEQSLAPDIHVLSYPPDRRPFILSTVSQHALTRRYRIWAALGLMFSIGSAALIFELLRRQNWL